MSDAVASYGTLARWYDPIYDARGKDDVGEAQALLDGDDAPHDPDDDARSER